jgi:hypothetical protein
MIRTRSSLPALVALVMGVTGLSMPNANAALVLTSGNVGGVTDQNVVFQNVVGNNTTTLTTDTNSNPANRITFTSNEALTGTESAGQARISDTGANGFNLLTWFLADNSLGFAANVFNINDLTATLANITVVTNLQTAHFDNQAVSLTGNNFFTLQSSGGEIIKSVSVSAVSGLFADVRQERIGDVQSISAAVPEPATWAMLILGFAGVGFMAYRRKNQGSAFRIA